MKQRRRVNGTDVTQPVPPRSGLVQLLSEPPQITKITGRPIPATAWIINVQMACNIRPLTQLVNIKCSAESRPARRVICLTTGGLFR
jgi:hypothetical protein